MGKIGRMKKEGKKEENEKTNLPPAVKSDHRHPSPRQETGGRIGKNDVFDWNQDDRSLSWKNSTK